MLHLPDQEDSIQAVERIADTFATIVPAERAYPAWPRYRALNDQLEHSQSQNLFALLQDAVRLPYGDPDSLVTVQMAIRKDETAALRVGLRETLTFSGRISLSKEDGVTYLDRREQPSDAALSARLQKILESAIVEQKAEADCPGGEWQVWSRLRSEKRQPNFLVQVQVGNDPRRYFWPKEDWCNTIRSRSFADELLQLLYELEPKRTTINFKRSGAEKK